MVQDLVELVEAVVDTHAERATFTEHTEQTGLSSSVGKDDADNKLDTKVHEKGIEAICDLVHFLLGEKPHLCKLVLLSFPERKCNWPEEGLGDCLARVRVAGLVVDEVTKERTNVDHAQ